MLITCYHSLTYQNCAQKLKNGGQDAKYISEIFVKPWTQKAKHWPSPQTHTDGSELTAMQANH